MNSKDLTPRQREIVNGIDPTLIALGGAETGKTTTALFAARAELERRAESYQRVLFLTFSRTAVAQILARAGRVLDGVDERVEILTFHGFAYRLAIDFGRYVGLGRRPPDLVAESEAAMGGAATGNTLRFDDLLPLALRVVESPFVRRLLVERWPLVICDEFQDTGDDHWALLERLAPPARLLLLADPNQMIYDGFVPGVGSHRLRAAEARRGARSVTLEGASQRDPTQVLPAAATDIRRRRFEAPDVERAVAAGRLEVRSGILFAAAPETIKDLIEVRRKQGDSSFGVYVHGNGPAAELSVGLRRAGIENSPVGFPESYGQSLAVMLEALRYIHGESDWSSVGHRLGVLATALSRSKQPPDLAWMLAGARQRPRVLQTRMEELRAGCDRCSPSSPAEAADVAGDLWPRLGITRGERTWRRAQEAFVSLVAAHASFDPAARLAQVSDAVDRQRMNSYVDIDGGGRDAVQVMNLHQTKGREADATFLVFRDGEYFGGEVEPFERNSRLLYVGLTRARNRATVLLGDEPHDLVAPLQRYAN